MTSFHEVRFPDNIAYGATGGPEFATTVVATGAGHEKLNVNWSEARGRWDVASGLKKQAQIDELIAFFRARRGRAYGFRFKDWTDNNATGQLLGTGDDALTQFQLLKHYPSGSVIEVRTITKPVAGTVKVYLDGLEQLSGWSVDTTVGLVTFSTAPPVGVEVTADFEFDVPVRFDTDHMAVTSITLAAADFGKSTMSVSAPAYDEQSDRLLLTAEFDEGPRHLISYSKDEGILWSRPINSQESCPTRRGSRAARSTPMRTARPTSAMRPTAR